MRNLVSRDHTGTSAGKMRKLVSRGHTGTSAGKVCDLVPTDHTGTSARKVCDWYIALPPSITKGLLGRGPGGPYANQGTFSTDFRTDMKRLADNSLVHVTEGYAAGSGFGFNQNPGNAHATTWNAEKRVHSE